jgi:DNA-binding MarR family transcriptional regulator
MSEPESKNRPRLAYAVAFLERSLRRALSEALRQFELSLTQYTVLSLLGMQENLSNAQLARRAYVTPQAMSEIVRYLEARKLVVRKQSPDHARIHPARLTAKGRSTLDKCDAAVDKVEARMVEDAGLHVDGDLVQVLMSYARVLDRGGRAQATQ